MSPINFEKYFEEWRAGRLPEGKGPKLTDSYIKKLLCQFLRRYGINLQSKDIPIELIKQKREHIKNLRFIRQAQAYINESEEEIKKRKAGDTNENIQTNL